uniref:Uncharacterized protein n=1 Tax=Strongyloides venezuelensis TaxID=75913 RepID=A0A0K0FTA6_STRVS
MRSRKPSLDLNNKAPNRFETPRVFVTVIVNLLFATSLLNGGSDFELTILNKHTSNSVAERIIKTRCLLLKKDESTLRRGNSFQRRVAIVTRNYNRIEHSSTDKRPRDLIFAFSIYSILRDSEDVKLKNLKIATL